MAGLDFRLTIVYLRALGPAWLSVGDVVTALGRSTLLQFCSSVAQ